MFRREILPALFISSLLLARPCPDVETWLAERPSIANGIVWEEPTGRVAWPDWPLSLKAELKEDVGAYCAHRKPPEIPDPIPNTKRLADKDFAATIYAPALARRLYLRSVAQSLFLELTHQLRWSVARYSPSELSLLFDSRDWFDWDGKDAGYALNEDRNGLISPSSPDRVLTFLRKHRLIGGTRRETLLRFLKWTTGLTHDFSSRQIVEAGYRRETPFFLEHFWQFRGFPPVLRVLEGTRQTLIPEQLASLRHWTAGCWGTTGLIKSVLRDINIPVELRQVSGHALPYFPTEKAFLSHGDDPYNVLFKTQAQPLPVADLLVDSSRWLDYFGKKGSEKIGYTPTKIAVKRIPNILVSDYCRDLASHLSREKGSVFRILKPYFSLDQLQRMGFWQRLENARKKKGC